MTAPAPVRLWVPLAAIVLDGSTQCRADGTDEELVKEYAARRRAGVALPAPEVFTELRDGALVPGAKVWIGDGEHRVRAALHNGVSDDIECDVFPGGEEEAFTHALTANERNGKTFTREDKRNAARRALLRWPHLSTRQIAAKAGLGRTMLDEIRKKLLEEGALQDDGPREGADGKKRRLPGTAPEQPEEDPRQVGLFPVGLGGAGPLPPPPAEPPPTYAPVLPGPAGEALAGLPLQPERKASPAAQTLVQDEPAPVSDEVEKQATPEQESEDDTDDDAPATTRAAAAKPGDPYEVDERIALLRSSAALRAVPEAERPAVAAALVDLARELDPQGSPQIPDWIVHDRDKLSDDVNAARARVRELEAALAQRAEGRTDAEQEIIEQLHEEARRPGPSWLSPLWLPPASGCRRLRMERSQLEQRWDEEGPRRARLAALLAARLTGPTVALLDAAAAEIESLRSKKTPRGLGTMRVWGEEKLRVLDTQGEGPAPDRAIVDQVNDIALTVGTLRAFCDADEAPGDVDAQRVGELAADLATLRGVADNRVRELEAEVAKLRADLALVPAETLRVLRDVEQKTGAWAERSPLRVALIGCSAMKAEHAAPARELYRGPLFKAALAYAEREGFDAVYVLSAKHGLVELGQELEPYDTHLAGLTQQERDVLSVEIVDALNKHLEDEPAELTILAGREYVALLEPGPWKVHAPLAGLQIGECLHFLKEQEEDGAEPPAQAEEQAAEPPAETEADRAKRNRAAAKAARAALRGEGPPVDVAGAATQTPAPKVRRAEVVFEAEKFTVIVWGTEYVRRDDAQAALDAAAEKAGPLVVNRTTVRSQEAEGADCYTGSLILAAMPERFEAMKRAENAARWVLVTEGYALGPDMAHRSPCTRCGAAAGQPCTNYKKPRQPTCKQRGLVKLDEEDAPQGELTLERDEPAPAPKTRRRKAVRS